MQPAQQPDNRRGIIAMVLSMAFFVTNDTLMKLAREDLSTGQVMTIRGVFGVLITLGLVRNGRTPPHPHRVAPDIVIRGLIELTIAVRYIIALGHLPLADLTAIMQSTPLIIALYLALTGAERMGWRRWARSRRLWRRPARRAAGRASFGIYSVLAFMSAILVAVRDLRHPVRHRDADRADPDRLRVDDRGGRCGPEPAGGMEADEHRHGRHPRGAALFVVLGNYAAITAFRNVEIAVVSPFRYSVILLAALAAFFIFGDMPDLAGAIGAMLIVCAGLYTVHRERIRSREKAAAAALPATEMS